MPFQLSPPFEQEFELEQTDKDYGKKGDPPTKVLIRQAKQGEHERRSNLFSQIIREQSVKAPEDIVRFIQRWSMEELKRLEVFLTLKACNIQKPDGSPLWDFDKNGNIRESMFDKGWEMLPVSVAREIHDCVLIVNPDWDRLVGEEA